MKEKAMNRSTNTIQKGSVEYPFAIGIGVYQKNTEPTKEEINYIENIDWQRNIGNDIGDNYQLFRNPIFTDLSRFCNEAVNEYYQGLLQYDTKLDVVLSWANRTVPGEQHHLHRHPNSVISGVYYYDSTELCPIELHSPWLPMNPYSDKPREYTYLNSDVRQLAVEANTAICFPSFLWHQVPKSRDTKARYSVAFNAFFSKGQTVGQFASALST